MTNENKIPAPPSMSRQAPSKGDNGGLLKIAGIALVVSLVAIFVYSYLVGGIATKKYTDTTFAPVSTLTQLQADIASAKSSLDTAIAGLPVTVSTQVNTSTSEFANRINQVSNDINALQSEINTLQSKVDNFNNSELTSKYNTLSEQVVLLVNEITALKDNLETYNTNLTNLTTRVTALETVTPSTPDANAISFKVNTIGNVPLLINVIGNNNTQTWVGTSQLVIQNNTNQKINNLVVGMVFAGYGNQFGQNNFTQYITPATIPQLISNGGTITWSIYQTNTQGLMFINGWGYGVTQLSIPANSSITIWLSLSMGLTVPTGTTLNTYLDIEPFVQSYN